MFKRIVEYSKVIGLTFVITILIFTVLPKIFGYNIIYSTEVNYDFSAMSAWGTVLGAFIPLLLVVASHIVTKKVDESNERTQREIQDSNAITADYVKQMIEEAIVTNPNVVDLSEEEIQDRLKKQAYKYVSLQGVCNTSRVAEHLNISKNEAFDLLVEMLRVDSSISAGGQVYKDNMDTVVWMKRRK